MSIHDLSKEKQEVALAMGFVPMFASRDTLEEANEYFMMIVESLSPGDKVAMLTAHHVLENTKILLELEVQTDDLFNEEA
jgi:hypothetical protein